MVSAPHRQPRAPGDPAARRAAFQTSPHVSQRQYAFSSGLRAVVLIDRDWHAGHTVGVPRTVARRDESAAPLPNFQEFMGLPSEGVAGSGNGPLSRDPRLQFRQINPQRAVQPRADEIDRAELPVAEHTLDLRLRALAAGAQVRRRRPRGNLVTGHDHHLLLMNRPERRVGRSCEAREQCCRARARGGARARQMSGVLSKRSNSESSLHLRGVKDAQLRCSGSPVRATTSKLVRPVGGRRSRVLRLRSETQMAMEWRP